jgi:hypothetical protein
MRFSAEPPYEVLETDCIDAGTMQRLARCARYWDLIANSGRFGRTLPLLLGEQPFARFTALANWLYRELGRTHAIENELLYEKLLEWLARDGRRDAAMAALADDYMASGARGKLSFGRAGPREQPRPRATPPRQARRLRA